MSAAEDALRALQELVRLAAVPGVDPDAVRAAQGVVEAVGLRQVPDPFEADLVGAVVDFSRRLTDYAIDGTPGSLAALDRSKANLAEEVSRTSDRAWSAFWSVHALD